MAMEIETEDSMNITNFFPVQSYSLVFKLKAENAHVMLCSVSEIEEPFITIMLGGEKMNHCMIVKNRNQAKKRVRVQGILEKNKLKQFWISWYDGNIRVGLENRPEPILSWTDPEPFQIAFFGVRTCLSTGRWIIEPGYNIPSGPWVLTAGDKIPVNSAKAGFDGDGHQLYVGRARFQGELIPGRVKPLHKACYIPWKGGEYAVSNFEVLTQLEGGMWCEASNGYVPRGAIPCGTTKDGEILYVGRVQFSRKYTNERTTYVGKVQKSKNACLIPCNGKELPFRDYDVLVCR